MGFFDHYFNISRVFTSNDSSDQENHMEQPNFFYPNACQICGCMERLLRCSRCQMISYCGKRHQSEHWSSHKTFCKILTEVRKKGDLLKGAKGRKQEAWVNARVGLINLVSTKLLRKLTPYEEKVIKFTRACLICHDTDQQNLINCSNCASVTFCQQHKTLFEKDHAEKCLEFKLCYIFDLEKLEETYNHQSKKEAKPKKERTESKKEFEWEKKFDSKKEKEDEDKESKEEVKEYLDPNTKITVIKEAPIKLIPYFNKCPDSMKKFLKILFPLNLNDNLSGKEKLETLDLFVKPLNVYQALKKLDRVGESDLVIHVIGAKVEDLDSYLFWETLLHWMPNLISLKIVVVSQELGRQNLRPKLCEKCVETEKKLVFELYNLGYKKFMEEKNFSAPSLVFGFKIQAEKEVDLLLSIANFNDPFAFTSDVEKVAKENHKYIKKIFGKLVDYDVFERNPFLGVKPHLDFETDGISYDHQFLTIYTNLRRTATNNTKKNEVHK